METYQQYLQQIQPTELLIEELAEPLKAIVRIFDSKSIDILKSNFWELIRRCSLGRHWPCFLDPSIALACQKQMTTLIDALYLELMRYEAEAGNISESEAPTPLGEQEDMEFEFLKGKYFILNAFKGRILQLNIEEVQNPYLTLRYFFKQDSPKNWKGLQTKWVDYALGEISELKVYEKGNILSEFEEFNRLIEAGYLLYIDKKRDYLPLDYLWETAILEKYFGSGGVRYSSKLELTLVDFLKTVPASRATENLRKVFIGFVPYHPDTLPAEMKEILKDIVSIIELLEVAAEEQRRLKIKP